MSFLRLVVSSFSLAVLCAACSDGGETLNGTSGGTSGTGGSTDTSAEAFATACAEHAGAVCAKELECYGPSRGIEIGPLAQGSARIAEQCVKRAALPGTGLTPPGLDACAAAMSAPGCGVFTHFPQECQFAGSLAEGADCADNA